MGVGPETVSKWENDKEPIGPQSDRLLRLLVVHETPLDDYSLDALKGLALEPKPVRIKLVQKANHWQQAASA